MKSKRSPLYVVTDDSLKVDMHFFDDNGKMVIIHCKESHILKLAKEIKENKLEGSRFVHLSPEISFFLKGKSNSNR